MIKWSKENVVIRARDFCVLCHVFYMYIESYSSRKIWIQDEVWKQFWKQSMFSIFYRFWICDYLCIGNTSCTEQFHCVFFAYFRFLARDQYQPWPRNRNQSMERSSSVMQSTTPPMGPQRHTLEVTTRILEPSLPQVWLPYRGAKNPDDWLTEDSQYLPMDAIWPYRL